MRHGKTVAEILKHERMKPLFSILSVILVYFWSAVVSTNAQANVTQFHNHDSRDGLYVDSAFTQSAAANLTRDLDFDGTIVGDVYAQPLYLDDGPGGRPTVIAVTESNNVYALDAVDGSVIWERNVGPPVSAGDLECTKFDPMGIIGTPIVDLASRALFLDAMTTPDGGETKKHLIFSLNVDTGDINPGWPVDVEETVSLQRHNIHCGDPTATTGARHRRQHSLCWIREYEGLRRLSRVAGRSAN